MTTYLSFAIEHRGSSYVARRRTKEAIYQLSPAKTLAEIKRKIDLYWIETPFAEW